MRIQIIQSKNQKFLKEFYGCYLYKIYEVIRVREFKSHPRCKIKREWKEYEINVKHTYPHNHFGQKAAIRIKEDECKVLPD